MIWLAVAAGGALGAVLRYAAIRICDLWLGSAFAWSTLLVNVLGSAAAGGVLVLLMQRYAEQSELRAFWMVGVLGALTTFSTFSLETLQLIESGRWAWAGMNVLANVLLCLLACLAGMTLARSIA